MGNSRYSSENREILNNGYDPYKETNDNIFHQNGRDTLKELLPPVSAAKNVAEGNVARENGDYKGAAASYAKAGLDVAPLGKGASVVVGGGGVKEAVKEAAKSATSPKEVVKTEVGKAGVDATLGNDDGNTAKMLTPELNGNNNPLSGGEKDKPQTEEDSKSAWEKFVENFIEKPLEWLGWKDKDTPESQPTDPNGQGETDPTGSGNEDNDNPNNPNGNPEPLQLPGAGNGFGAGLGGGNGAGTKDLGDPKTPFYDPLLIALQTGGNNTSISVVSHNEKYNACNDECFFQAA